jgi:EAL domain-containing protein (putative c-di-GMP-specific phosphodiesterase class I)
VNATSLLDRILEPGALSVVFQPVVQLSGSQPAAVDYFEGLVRCPAVPSLERPDVLFAYVRRKRAEAAVDRACAAAIFAAAAGLGAHVGLNVHASTLAMDLEFPGFLADTAEQHGLGPAQLVVEVVEHAAPWHVRPFREAVATLRDIGVRLALDDLGAGLSNYRMLLDCRPSFFKLDGYISRGAARDFYRQAVLRSVVQLARPFGARVVAEGIECAADLAAARDAGVQLAQGFVIAAAAPAETYVGQGARGAETAACGCAPPRQGGSRAS